MQCARRRAVATAIAVAVGWATSACGARARSDASVDAGTDALASTDAAPDAGPSDGGAPLFTPVGVNVPAGPLCDIAPGYVAAGGDPVNPPCAFESDSFTDRDPATVPPQLRLAAWNVRFGVDSATVGTTLLTHPDLAGADVLLLSEVARYDLASNPPLIDQARDLAMALAMDYVFAVEWDRRENPAELGEHGVAILSKYPLGNVLQIRHTPLNDWWTEDNLYGGRTTLAADVLIGGALVRLYSSHLDTRGGDAGRALQGAEVRADADIAGRPPVQAVGGDLNTWTCNPIVSDCTMPPAAETVVEDFLAAAWLDGTVGFNGATQLGGGVFPQRLDWIFYRGAAATPGTGLSNAAGSDHYPVFFSFDPP